MDYGRILTRAWEITWRWKILWILGFLAALGQGSGSNVNYNLGSGSGTSSDWYGWGPWSTANWGGLTPEQWGARLGAVVAALCCVGVLIVIVVFVLSTIARGGLIAGVREVEEEGRTTLGSAWRGGVRRFWTLAGIWLITLIPAILAILFVIILVVISITGGVLGSDISDPAAALGVLGPWLLCGCPLCCGLIIVTLVLGLVQNYADRAAVLDGLGWIDAFRRGWQLFKTNLGPTLVFWLVTVAIGLLVGFLIFGLFAVVGLPAWAILQGAQEPALTLVAVCGGGLLAAIVLAVLSAIIQTFTSAMWTLVYRGLPHRAVPSPVPAE